MPATAGRRGVPAGAGPRSPARSRWRGALFSGRVGVFVIVLIFVPLLWMVLGSGDRPTNSHAGSEDVALPDSDEVDRPADETDGDEDGEADREGGGGDDEESPRAEPGLGCTPVRCARWRLDDLDPRRLDVHEQLLVYVEESRVTTVDPIDGSKVHQLDVPVPGGGELVRSATATYVDEEYLVVAHGRVLSIVALPDGELERQVLFDASVYGISRTGDGWTLRGASARNTEDRPRVQLLGVDRDGQVRWERDVDALISLPEAADDVLLLADGDLQLVDPVDGRSRWRHPLDPERTYVLRTDPLVLVDQQADRLEVLDRDTGDLLTDLEVAGLDSAGVAGPWTFAVTGTELVLFDPADGREVVRREHDATRPVMVEGVTIGEGEERRVVIAWPYTGEDRTSDQELVEVYAPDGTLLRFLDIPVPVTAKTSGPWPSQVVSLGDGVVRVAVGLGRDILEVDIEDGQVLDGRHHELAEGEEVFWFEAAIDGVFAAGTAERIRLEGRGGGITVHGTEPTLRSHQPLLVADGDQLLRLDERLLHGR